jgi:hypothetical protein
MPPLLKPRVTMDSGSSSASSAHTFFTSAVGPAPGDFFLSHQEQGVEHDRLSEGNSQNRLDQNLR